MHYYIDGYNLLFRVFYDATDLQSLRQQMIYDLSMKAHVINIDISLVFDASFRTGESAIHCVNHLKVCFTDEGETADDFIIDCLGNHYIAHRKEVLVTSDKRLAWRARNLGAITQSVEEFLPWLNKAYRNKLRHVKKDKKPIPIPSKVVRPAKPVEGGLEYYLHVFETRYQSLTSN